MTTAATDVLGSAPATARARADQPVSGRARRSATMEPVSDQLSSKGEQTRRAVLDAAIARFGRDGFRATSVTDIARAAGVGPTVPYTYFPNKEALFLAACDEDAAELIGVALAELTDDATISDWRSKVVYALVASVENHPLTRRLLSGQEPDVTGRVLEIPALDELRRVCAERLERDQAAGLVRTDIDPTSIANGVITLILSVLMSVVQVGIGTIALYAADVAAVFEAALLAPPTPEPPAPDA